ncbi:D-alanyl-D-alanine carboxypeptidase/D-alanyl-D-alanine endopeptidase [Amycolatopsis circi]|uniref:D-alanyl-D-alanine carboxypeptidase/D-alanyl-D-alanine endopeptidase n=1 Tax=Amycolatopsis circi TaxID=871959 RepID=UPI001FC98541|nr:D-alanyl-D-alanine carboxypeptidase/D-alanyl-D-alanine-endopeptidase [Amycolatopsis circi]
MPENDQPRWPTGDEDTSSATDRATSRLPLPKRDAGATAQLSVPNVTPGDGPGSWFQPNVPPEEVPGLNAPSDAPASPPEPPRSNLADRMSGASAAAPAGRAEEPKPQTPWVPVEGPTRFVAGVPRPGDNAGRPDAEATVQSSAVDSAEGAGEKTFQVSQQQPRPSAEGAAEQTVRAQPNVSSGQQESSPSWQAARKPGNSLFEPAGAGSGSGDSGDGQGWNPFQSGQPGQSAGTGEPAGKPGQFAAFRDETPATGDSNQGWAAFRPIVSRDEQGEEPPKEGWTAFRNDSGSSESGAAGSGPAAADQGQPGRAESGARPAQPGRVGDQSPENWPGSSGQAQTGRTGAESQENRSGFRGESSPAHGSAAARLNPGQPGGAGNESPENWPASSNPGQSGRGGDESPENWPASSNAGQPGRAGNESPENWPASSNPGQSGRGGDESQANRNESGAEPWSQEIEIPVRPGLPEPQPGTVPPAGAGHVRPMRIDPAGGQFPAEATVGIPRPPEGFPYAPEAQQGASEATIGIPAQAEGFAERPGPEQIQPRNAAEQYPPEPPAGAGPVPPAADAPRPEGKKPRRKVLILALVVLLLLAAAGGASAVPAVSNRLGLPWAPNAPKGSEPDPSDASLALHGPDTSGQGPSANGVASKLSGPAGAAALSQLSGSVIDPANGTVLWDHASNTPLTPASTTKILTVSAALLSMEPTKRISTKIVQGAQPGTVVIVGGGDPSLTALPVGTDSPLYPGAAHVDDLVNQVKKAGGNVTKVQLDASAFSGPNTAPGWEPGDAPSLYGAPIVPAMTDGGRGNPKADETMRSGNPGTALTQLVADKLGASPAGPAKAPEGAKVLGEVQSAPLPDLAYALLQISDNVLADSLGRQVAMATGGEASFAGASAAVKKVLADHGFDVNGLQLFDTSGLSNQNKVPARLLAQVLAAAAGPDGKDPNTPKLRPLLAGLPVAGSPEGTLHGRYHSGETQGGKGWVRAKTGTLTGVNTLAGYVLDSDNRVLAFAFMSNGSDKNSGQAALDVLATALRSCGCK